MTQALAGRTALVTGADRGIGAGIANLLDQQGVRVCRNVMVHPEVPDTGGEQSRNLIIQADLRDPNQVQRMFGQIKQEFGGLDLLINNAGVESIIPQSTSPPRSGTASSIPICAAHFFVPRRQPDS